MQLFANTGRAVAVIRFRPVFMLTLVRYYQAITVTKTQKLVSKYQYRPLKKWSLAIQRAIQRAGKQQRGYRCSEKQISPQAMQSVSVGSGRLVSIRHS